MLVLTTSLDMSQIMVYLVNYFQSFQSMIPGHDHTLGVNGLDGATAVAAEEWSAVRWWHSYLPRVMKC